MKWSRSFALGALALAGAATASAASSRYDFSGETLGAEPRAFVAVVGVWRIDPDGANKALAVDGTKWSEGQPSAGLADRARAVYGERYAEFLDNVKTYSYFPIAIAKDIQDFHDGEITVRFKGIRGRIDQGAGILFNVKPNGDYLAMRANCLENNLVLWKVIQGKRSSVKWVRNTPTPSGQWHDLKLEVHGRDLKGYLDGKLYLEHTLSEPVSGKIGLWSKADSYVLFDDYTVVTSNQ